MVLKLMLCQDQPRLYALHVSLRRCVNFMEFAQLRRISSRFMVSKAGDVVRMHTTVHCKPESLRAVHVEL